MENLKEPNKLSGAEQEDPGNILDDGRVVYFINFARWEKCNIIELKGLLEFFRNGRTSYKWV